MERSKRQCPSPLNTALQTLFRSSRTILLLERIRQAQIEQNRCAMACQGCGAVLFLLKKQWNYFS